MLFRDYTITRYTMVITFANGTQDIIKNVFHFELDTNMDRLTVYGINDDDTIWNDRYGTSNIYKVNIY